MELQIPLNNILSHVHLEWVNSGSLHQWFLD